MKTMVEVAARMYDQFDYNGVYAIVSGLQAHNLERIPSLSPMNLPGWLLKKLVYQLSSFFFVSVASADAAPTCWTLQCRKQLLCVAGSPIRRVRRNRLSSFFVDFFCVFKSGQWFACGSVLPHVYSRHCGAGRNELRFCGDWEGNLSFAAVQGKHDCTNAERGRDYSRAGGAQGHNTICHFESARYWCFALLFVLCVNVFCPKFSRRHFEICRATFGRLRFLLKLAAVSEAPPSWAARCWQTK